MEIKHLDSDRLVFMADAHIKGRTWTNSMLLSSDAYMALDRLAPKAAPYGTLIIGGDWFDGPKPSCQDLDATQRFLSQFSQVWYINGNHDRNVPSFLSLPFAGVSCNHLPDVCLVTPSGCAITGLDWTHDAKGLKQALKDTVTAVCDSVHPTAVCIVLHSSFDELLGVPGASQLSLADVKAAARTGVPLHILVGDIHIRRTFGDGAVTVHSPGSLYPLSWDRTGATSTLPVTEPLFAASAVDFSGGHMGTDDLTAPVRLYYSIQYQDHERLDAFYRNVVCNNVFNYPLKPFLRVVIPAGMQDVTILPSNYPDCVMQAVKEDQAEAEEQLRIAGSGYTLESAVHDELEAAGGDELLERLAVSLLGSADVTADVSGWLDYWHVERSAK